MFFPLCKILKNLLSVLIGIRLKIFQSFCYDTATVVNGQPTWQLAQYIFNHNKLKPS